MGTPIKFTVEFVSEGNADVLGVNVSLAIASPCVQSNLGFIQCSGALVGSSSTAVVELLGTFSPLGKVVCVSTYALADATSVETTLVAEVRS